MNVCYRPTGDNAVLRAALQHAYGSKCYWCNVPKEFPDLDIDHIVPRGAPKERFEELGRELQLDAKLQTDDPGNLAPICRRCNREKSGSDYTNTARVLLLLKRAQGKRAGVVAFVERFGEPTRLAQALLMATEADLSDARMRDTFMELAPEVARRLAIHGYDFGALTPPETLAIDMAERGQLDVEIALDGASVRAWTILEDACGGAWHELLKDAVPALLAEVRSKAQSDMEADDEDYGPTNAGQPELDIYQVAVDRVEFTSAGSEFEFEIAGTFEVGVSASVVRNDYHDEGLLELQGEGYVTGTFSFPVFWTPDAGLSNADSVEITSWNLSLSVY